MIDTVRLREFENGGGRVDRLDHMHGETAVVEIRKARPNITESDHALDVLVVTGFVQGRVDGEPALLEHVETGQPAPTAAFARMRWGRDPQRVFDIRVSFRLSRWRRR